MAEVVTPEKASRPMVGTVVAKQVTGAKAVQLLKVEFPTEVTVLGIVIEVKAVQPKKLHY